MFRMMNMDSSTFKSSRLAVILDIMKTISQRQGPDIFFDFDGRDSGLQLVPFVKGFPGGEGYGYCSWIRVESFDDPTGGRHYQPYLFSFTSKEGTGLELYFVNRLLHLKINVSKYVIIRIINILLV